MEKNIGKIKGYEIWEALQKRASAARQKAHQQLSAAEGLNSALSDWRAKHAGVLKASQDEAIRYPVRLRLAIRLSALSFFRIT